MIYLASDFHLGHANIIKLSKRPHASLEAMQEECLTTLRKTLCPTDTLVYLGDWWFGSPEDCRDFILQIPTENIIFCTGNHDAHAIAAQHKYRLFKTMCERYEFYYDNRLIVCSHYQHAVWNKAHHGSLHAFGHSHRKAGDHFGPGRSCEVGYDSTGKWLVSVPEFIEWVKDRPTGKHHE